MVKNLFTGETYCYNAYDEVVSYTDAESNVTKVVYDAQGNVTSTRDALGAVTTYEYDNESRPVKVTTLDGTVTEYTYNSDGSITRIAATKGNGEAEELYYLYALDGSLTVSISSSDILEYAYNNRGSVTSVTKNNTHQVKLTYDGNGNMTRLEELTDSITESVTNYTYDKRGSLTKVSTETEGLLASYISRADGM
ncbi:MAG: hypothetical protein IJZ25_02775, partial [Lachnospiraceae bacterium]|nr:hypothetical protein [Lachnospiraceae bacterium]